MRAVQRSCLAGAVVLLAATVGCDTGFFHEPSGPATLAVQATFSYVAGGSGEAYDQADAFWYRLTPVSGQSEPTEAVIPFVPGNPETRVSIAVTLSGSTQDFDFEAELRSGGTAVFTGQSRVTLSAGVATETSLPLAPVISGVQAQDPVQIDQLGVSVQLEAEALFSTGDVVEGVPLSWRIVNQSGPVVTLTPGGLVTAVGEGSAVVEVTGAGFSDPTTVTVQATVASVTVTPAEYSLRPGERVELTAVAKDAGGSILVRSFQWRSDAPSVASVDANGFVLGEAPGEALIAAETEGVPGFAHIDVFQPEPTVTTGDAHEITTGAYLNGQVDPQGLPTYAWFEWGEDPMLDSYYETSLQDIGSGLGPVPILDYIEEGMLAPSTVYYFRAVGQNDAGFSLGDIVSFATPPLPSVVTLPVEIIDDNANEIYDVIFQGQVNPFGLNATAWFEFSDFPDFSTIPFSTQPRDLGSAPSTFAERLPQSTFSCCVIIYVRAVALTAMGFQVSAAEKFTLSSGG